MDQVNLLLIQFDLHHRLYNNVLDGFSEAEVSHLKYGIASINYIKYLAGHLLNSNYGLAKMAGMNPQGRWDDLFTMMRKTETVDNFSYPNIGEILKEWNILYPGLRFSLGSLSPEDLCKKPPKPFDQISNSSGELWAFVNHHVAYHIGQIEILLDKNWKTL